jgi:type VI secretion system protein ImpA
MPLRDDILNPIPGENPSGENLRYAPVFDKIKEARRQDDEGPMGDWQRERKVADWTTVIKLAGEAIATKSKDLQLAVWLTEALLHKENIPGLQSGIDLIKGLIENFWDTLYPELDDGDSEMRAAPLDWLGAHYLEVPIKRVPLTKSGLNLLDYNKAKKVGREADASESYEKGEAFQAAVAAGELTLDEWDKAFNATSKEFYRERVTEIDNLLQTLEDFSPLAEEKFGEFAPSFSKLRSTVEEVRHQANQFLNVKLESNPDEPVDTADTTDESVEETEPVAEAVSYSSGAAAAPARAKARPKGSLAAEPTDREDAIERVASAARFWRTEDPYSPAPYLMLRGMRWGEVRANSYLDPATFEAPTSETRTSLKRLLSEGSYAEAIEIAEAAMATPAGRAWLDLQRYVVTALDNLGYSAVSEAIKAELAALLKSFPDLKTSCLLDDTPCANNETLEWLKSFAEEAAPEAAAPPPMPMWQPSYDESAEQSEDGEAAEKSPDAFDLAMEAVTSGRQQEAFEILVREAAHQNSGRGRFQRRLQLAQVCLSSGAESIAFPILQELAATIDKHRLEEWESPDMVAHAFALLYRCMTSDEVPESEKKTLYAKICRLDPVQALAQAK